MRIRIKIPFYMDLDGLGQLPVMDAGRMVGTVVSVDREAREMEAEVEDDWGEEWLVKRDVWRASGHL